MDSAVEHQELAERLNTIVGIPVTPFDGAGKVDEAAYIRVVERIADPNIGVLTANGNTSEFYALSQDEAARAVELTVEHGSGALVMAGIGLDLATAIAAGRRAQQAGAAMVMVHQPPHPYRSQSGWLDYHRAVADSLGDLGIVVYIRDPSVTPEMIRALAASSPNLVGVKYAVADLARFAEMAVGSEQDDFTWICGLAETWAPAAWLLGMHAYTSGLVNVAPRAAAALFERLRAGDYDGAMGLWRYLQPFEQIRNGNQGELNVSAVKEALFQLGLCEQTVRPPISVLRDPERQRVQGFLSDLRSTGLLEAA